MACGVEEVEGVYEYASIDGIEDVGVLLFVLGGVLGGIIWCFRGNYI